MLTRTLILVMVLQDLKRESLRPIMETRITATSTEKLKFGWTAKMVQ